jgi:hypothetical protein
MPIDSTEPRDDDRDGRDPDAVDDVEAVADVEAEDEAGTLDDVEDAPEDAVEFELDDDPEMSGDAALIARARKKYGIGGAMLAGGMLGLDRMLTGKVKQEAPVEWAAPGDPLDIDRKGIDVPLEDESVVRSRPGPAAAAGATSRRVTRRRRS